MKTETFTDDFFIPFLQKANKENKRLVLMGDFNINLLECGISSHVNDFVDSLESFYLLPSISLPTRITDRTRTLIDNIFFTPSKYKPLTGNLLSGISDHLPQFLIFENFHFNSCNETRYYRKWKNFDNNKFKEAFYRLDWKDILHSDSDNPDLLFESFFDRMNTLIDIHAPLKKLSNK